MTRATERTTASRADLPFDPRLPALAHLVDPGRIGRALAPYLTGGIELDACELVHARYKPGASCLALFRARVRGAGGERSERWLYGKCYTDEGFATAREKVRGAKASIDGLPSSVALEAERILLRPFPLDAELHGLHLVRSPKKLQRILYRILGAYPESDWRISDRRLAPEILRYKPEYRAVIRFTTRAVHRSTGEKHALALVARFQADDRGDALFRVSREIERATDSGPALVPTALAYESDHGALFTESVTGILLTDACLAGDRAAVRDAARALGRFHRLAGVSAAARDLTTIHDEARSAAESVADSVPPLRPAASRVLSWLLSHGRDLSFERTALVHGDMHDGQMIMTSAGPRVIDLERVHRGDSLEDVGSMCAHFHLAGAGVKGFRDVFLREYEIASGLVLDGDRVRYWTVHRMLMLCSRPYRSLSPRWREQTERLIRECERVAQ